MFLLISMLLDLLVARVGCGVGGGGYEIQRGTYGVSLMIMITNEYHEIMHVAYMHAHVHVL